MSQAFPDYPDRSRRETYLTPSDLDALNRGDTITKITQDNTQIEIHSPPMAGLSNFKRGQLLTMLDQAERQGDGFVSVQAVRGAISGT